MKRSLLACIAFFLPFCLSSLRAVPEVMQCVPGEIFLEAGGRQINAILRGKELDALGSVRVVSPERPMKEVYCQLGPVAPNRRTLTLIANPNCPLGSKYTVQALTREKKVVAIPVKLTLVEAGDRRATSPDTATVAEAAEVARGERIVVAEKVVPQILETVPSPLVVEPDGQMQVLLLKGKNLGQVTEIRVRRAEQPAEYRGKRGLLPMKNTEEGLSVVLTASPETAMGSRYMLDLMVKRYLAASVPVYVGEAPAPPVSGRMQQQEPAQGGGVPYQPGEIPVIPLERTPGAP